MAVDDIKISLVQGYLSLEFIGGRKGRWHRHEPGQLIYCSQGSLSVQTESENGVNFWYVPAFQGIWIPPNVLHVADLNKGTKVVGLYIEKHQTEYISQDVLSFQCSNLLKELISACSKLDFSKKAISKRDERLLLCLVDQLVECRHDTIHFPLPKEPRLQKLVALLLSEPENKEHITTLAKRIGASSKTLSRLLARELRISFSSLRNSIRIFHACKALQSNKPIAEIAYSLGFSSQAAFTSQFKKHLGTTPMQYMVTASSELLGRKRPSF